MNPTEYLTQHPELAEYIHLVKMDDRSLSQILNKAVEHYERFRETDDQGEKAAYIWEMLTLKEHVNIARTEYEELDRIELAEAVLKILKETEKRLEHYSRKHLEYIRQIVALLDKPVVESSDIKECAADFERMRGKK